MNRSAFMLGLAVLAAGLAADAAGVTSAAAALPPTGAATPWTTFEAERARTDGQILGPGYAGQTPAREASGRRCVRLAATGEYLEFAAKSEARGLVVRYCIPDSADGRGLDATLTLYVNGKRRAKLPMTSRLAWLYGQYPFNNHPGAGTPRHFWDEARLMPGTIRAGDIVRLQKDADDTAPQYLIDFVDLEKVPAALQRPEHSISVIDFGATANDQSDDRPAFRAAIAAARARHCDVWIPPGRYLINGPLEVADVGLRGAGMWYSTLAGAKAYTPGHRVAVMGNGSNITLSDFTIIGNLNYRDDSEPNDGIGGSFGTGSSIRNIWVEHTKTGAWIVNSDGLRVEGCRFRDTIADGINLCLGVRNTIVHNCTARGTGDDGFAMWPAVYAKSDGHAGHNRFIQCTAQLPYLAQGFAIYGGDSNSVENCMAVDIPYGAGLYASTTFPTDSGFQGTTSYQHIHLDRAGGDDGAIGIVANRRDLSGLRFDDIDVIDSPTDGIKFISMKDHEINDTAFEQIRITNPGLGGAGSGIVAAAGAVGSATFNGVTVQNPRTASWRNLSAHFHLVRDSGNSGVAGNDQSSGTDHSAGSFSGG